jgi:hypothetical protein
MPIIARPAQDPFQKQQQIEMDHYYDCVQNGTARITGMNQAKKVFEILSAQSF